MKSKEQSARDFCNIKHDLMIDDEERYYKDFQKYDGFKAGFDESNRWVLFDDEKPNYREWVNAITTYSDVPITACFDTIRNKWYFYDFSDNEWYEFSTSIEVIKWRYCFRS